MTLLHKAVKKMNFGNLINIAISNPDTCVLAVGPKSCIRIFYFQARKQNLNRNLYMLPVSKVQLISSTHLNEFNEAIEEIFNTNNAKNLIVLIMCVDIILGSNFQSSIKDLERKYKKNIKLFKRGPLVDNTMEPSKRMEEIIYELRFKTI